MKLSYIKIAAVGLFLVVGSSLFAQNKNVVSAAVEYKKFDMAFLGGNVKEAKEVLLASKSYIDPAMEHESTKSDGKAHLYNGKIHFSLTLIATVLPDDEDLKPFATEANTERYESSLRFAHKDRKYKRDVEDFINKWITLSSGQAPAMFEKEEYAMAFAGFASAYQLNKIIEIDDEDNKNNALISAQNAIIKFKKEGKLDEALEFIEAAKEIFPSSNELIIEGINIALEQNDLDKAEGFFNAATELDPNNVVLFSSMGSIFLGAADNAAAQVKTMKGSEENFAELSELADKLYDKAEKNLKRAIELNAKDMNANYNLGVLYLGKGEKLAVLANSMELNDPRYNQTVQDSEEMYKKAIVPLEAYIDQDPENAGVLNVLFQVHKKAGNTEKALEYRRRAEAASN
jgi:tetratricopeptide (TPR) repeat protein